MPERRCGEDTFEPVRDRHGVVVGVLHATPAGVRRVALDAEPYPRVGVGFKLPARPWPLYCGRDQIGYDGAPVRRQGAA